MVVNQHKRILPLAPEVVGPVIDTLSSPNDRLWPHTEWPSMRLDRPLGRSARGGHGPIRYHVVHYYPGRAVRFRFEAPRGFNGYHEFVAEAVDPTTTLLRHTLVMRVAGPARLSWPLVFRPLHNALIRDSLDGATRALGHSPKRPARWSGYVRLLRFFLTRRSRPLRTI